MCIYECQGNIVIRCDHAHASEDNIVSSGISVALSSSTRTYVAAQMPVIACTHVLGRIYLDLVCMLEINYCVPAPSMPGI